jgi:cell pole-organizing protein PopZ
MEEILASIRRIIESNEPNGEGLLSTPLAPAYAEDDFDEAEDDISFVPDMAANDPGLPLRGSQPMSYPVETPAPSQPAERSLSLADVAARVRAASVRQQETVSIRPADAFPGPVPTLRELEPVPAPVMAAVQPVPQVTELRMATLPTAPSEPVRSEFQAYAPAGEMPVVQPPRSEPRAAEAAAPASLPAKIEEATLLSDEAGAQIARSFNELAAVFDGLERRSVEDMAQEMLRPMLQEWLDDNLPTLVERLVREEIERVARGPRR